MKKILIGFATFFGISTYCMETKDIVTNYSANIFAHAPVEKYPASISYLPADEVLSTQEITAIPADIQKEAEDLIKANPSIIECCQMPTNFESFNKKAFDGNSW